ncbi:diguanylate cyclase (GGDEF)-like protein [Catenuloplanes nepalensis]|uniref:Diguanylate cyclase (GGDEF)-like protein n=1 Tax=Catenuloplanes nepalensis TaxID=587533 RepID=A0ABT9MWN4_9ACTN|nr:EAL domain-containing protein [Catenuloplanes nepalensis]MDP9795851.1 diguanylate cyclase (GGDEF)-like protein [Catenuloplanes nepalensis]
MGLLSGRAEADGGDRWRDRLWWMFALVGVVATGLYVVGVAQLLDFALIGAGAVAACFASPSMNDFSPARAWHTLGAAGAFMLTGAILRPIVVPYGSALPAEAFTVPGYVLMIAALADFAYGRRAIDRHSVIDGLIVCVGASTVFTLLFAIPAMSLPDRPLIFSVLAALYPTFDAILVLLVVMLAFSTVAGRPAFRLLLGMMVLIFIGDLAYAVIGNQGEFYKSPVLDVPFLLAYTLGGASALHPTARELVRAMPLPVQPWSLARLAVIIPAVAAPFVLTVAGAPRTGVERWIVGLGGAVIVLLLILRAISAVQANAVAQARFEYQATHDELTGLPNRRRLTQILEELLAEPAGRGAVWVFFFDLDGFKFVNDSWGHPAGDRLIRRIGQRLRDTLPPEATVARIGGDEFVVVRRGTEAEALEQAQQIVDCVEPPTRVGPAEVVITASMGIVAATRADAELPTSSADSLMRDADTAMYRTKAAGRGKWTVFDASMRRAVQERLEIEGALRSALARDELRVFYQPIVDLESGRPRGAEALVRWEHPEKGAIGPNVFIPIAEESRLITGVGAFVLRDAVRQLAVWRAEGVVGDEFWMSINVSPRQLTEPGFTGMVAEALRTHGVPARCVALEITESVMVEGGEISEGALRDLRALGVSISVDDFGTGFSSLGYLRRHPVTSVKIDRSFVSGLGASSSDEEIVRAVVAMSAALGLTVVAEGVESTAQRDVLGRLGVRLCQGWLWGKAVDPSSFAERWSADHTVKAL